MVALKHSSHTRGSQSGSSHLRGREDLGLAGGEGRQQEGKHGRLAHGSNVTQSCKCLQLSFCELIPVSNKLQI
jgi:hypothetical protein